MRQNSEKTAVIKGVLVEKMQAFKMCYRDCALCNEAVLLTLVVTNQPANSSLKKFNYTRRKNYSFYKT